MNQKLFMPLEAEIYYSLEKLGNNNLFLKREAYGSRSTLFLWKCGTYAYILLNFSISVEQSVLSGEAFIQLQNVGCRY